MNDTAIKNFCIWARKELRQQVAQQALYYGITEQGYGDVNSDILDGRVLSPEEKIERTTLISKFLGEVDEGYVKRFESLIEKAAYTWFNRFAAIRFMEVNDRLFSRVRMFSDSNGGGQPQVLKEALSVSIEGVDQRHVADLLSAGDDEALFRYLFLAQCSELASCMPEVFEPIGSALELLLPQNLLRHGSVIERMVTDIPEGDWREGVEIVGWMYQYYNAELKDEVFASFKKGKKADASALKPATQLFTPNWIVRYLVENSLGRLWMQGHPSSKLPGSMPYYIPDEGEMPSSGSAPATPEEISVIDPACGSGHILVYAFELLGLIYEEAGYVHRDIPQMILTKNLTGLEIDERAAQWAAFALYMKGCEYDSRFLTRGVGPAITTLKPVSLTEEDLLLVPKLADRAKLLDAMAHMDECGSLFVPDTADMEILKDAKAKLESSSSMLSSAALDAIELMLANCEPLYRTYDVVVANPPYMGSSNMDKWLANWTSKNYPDSKRDLCTCFIERCVALLVPAGLAGLATSNSWMFISSFEKVREKVLHETTVRTLVQLSVHGFKGIAAQVCAFVLQQGLILGALGGYIRLNDFDHHSLQEEKTLEAIQNPDCGWFYRRSAEDFSFIPGMPIAYWASDAVRNSFVQGTPLSEIATPCKGVATGNNDRFLRMWWEVSASNSRYHCSSNLDSVDSGCKWFPNNKGGDYRKWYGNNDYVVNWENDGEEIKSFVDSNGKLLSRPQGASYYFKPSITWSEISSGSIAFRFKPLGHIANSVGPSIFGNPSCLNYLQGVCNSSVMREISNILSPTLQFEVGRVAIYPILEAGHRYDNVTRLVKDERLLSKTEYDSFETSWDFKRHPMV